MYEGYIIILKDGFAYEIINSKIHTWIYFVQKSLLTINTALLEYLSHTGIVTRFSKQT